MDPNGYLRRGQVDSEYCKSDTQTEMDQPAASFNTEHDMLRNTHEDVSENPTVDDVKIAADFLVRGNIEIYGAKNNSSDRTAQHLEENLNTGNTLLELAKTPSSDNSEKHVVENSNSCNTVIENSSGDNNIENIIDELSGQMNHAASNNEQANTDNAADINRGKDQLGARTGDCAEQNHLKNTFGECIENDKTKHSNCCIHRKGEVENPESLGKEECQVSQNSLQDSFYNPVDNNTGQNENNPVEHSSENPQTSQNPNTTEQNSRLRLTSALVLSATILVGVVESYKREFIFLDENLTEGSNIPDYVVHQLPTIQYFYNRTEFLFNRIIRYQQLLEMVVREIENGEDEPDQFRRRISLLQTVASEFEPNFESSEGNEINDDGIGIHDGALFVFSISHDIASGIILFLILVIINCLLQAITE